MHEPRTKRPRLVITGLGCVSPIGVGLPAFTAALREGRSGVRPVPCAHPLMKSVVSAHVPTDVFDPASVMDSADLARLPRMIPMALRAAREALVHAGFGETIEAARAERIGLVLGTGAGGIDFTLDQAFEGYAPTGSGRPSLWTITNATHGNLAGELSIRLGLKGPSWCVSTGCASGLDALGAAMSALNESAARGPEYDERFGLDAMVVVGADAHVRWETLVGMELLRVISTRQRSAGDDPATFSRPFDLTRDGFVLGEGAFAVVLARADRITSGERGAARAEVLGYGATCDAYHRVRPEPTMTECVRAMHMALAQASVQAAGVDLVHYHGTGTKLNDAQETMAVKHALGEEHARRVIGTSVKSMLGHPQGASGLASLCASLAGLLAPKRFVPPTINLRTPDPQCDLDYTPNRARMLDDAPKCLMVNCLAFGAKNSVVIVRA